MEENDRNKVAAKTLCLLWSTGRARDAGAGVAMRAVRAVLMRLRTSVGRMMTGMLDKCRESRLEGIFSKPHVASGRPESVTIGSSAYTELMAISAE